MALVSGKRPCRPAPRQGGQMISITTAVAAYAVVITVLYLIVQARVDEYDAEARDRAARRAKQPPIPAQREGAGR